MNWAICVADGVLQSIFHQFPALDEIAVNHFEHRVDRYKAAVAEDFDDILYVEVSPSARCEAFICFQEVGKVRFTKDFDVHGGQKLHCVCPLIMVREKGLTNCLWLYTLLDKEFVGDMVLVEGLAVEESVQLLEPLAEVDRKCLVDILLQCVVVWRLDGSLGGELAVIGDQRGQHKVNQARSHTQTSQTLQSTSAVLPRTSRWSQAPLELYKVLSDSARAF
jgi:hypothetical protein